MRLMKFTGHDLKPVVVNMDKLLYAATVRMTGGGRDMTQLNFPGNTVVIDMKLDIFLDLMTR